MICGDNVLFSSRRRHTRCALVTGVQTVLFRSIPHLPRTRPMATLTDDLASQLQGAPVQQVAQQLGIDSSQASSAIGAALPLLMGALGRNASQPEGAQALFGALQKDHAGGDIGSVLGSVLGGAQNSQTDGDRKSTRLNSSH